MNFPPIPKTISVEFYLILITLFFIINLIGVIFIFSINHKHSQDVMVRFFESRKIMEKNTEKILENNRLLLENKDKIFTNERAILDHCYGKTQETPRTRVK